MSKDGKIKVKKAGFMSSCAFVVGRLEPWVGSPLIIIIIRMYNFSKCREGFGQRTIMLCFSNPNNCLPSPTSLSSFNGIVQNLS